MRSIRMLARRATLGVATAGLLVTTAACGSSDDGVGGGDGGGGAEKTESRSQGTILEALQASRQKSEEATSASFETTMTMTMQMEPGEPPLELPLSMSGDVAWEPLAMDVTMDMSGYFAAFAEMMGSEEEPPSGEFSIRLVDQVLYMGGPLLAEELGGATWVKADLQEMAAEAGEAEAAALLEQFNQAEDMAQSPAEQLGLMLEAPDIEWRGTETVGGRETDAYEGEMTIDELIAIDPSSAELTEEELEKLYGDFEELGAETVNLEIWVDEDDYPARIDMTLDFPEGTAHYSTVYTGFGTGLDISHPDASEVVDAGELEDGGASLFGGTAGAGADAPGGGGEEMTDEELEEFLRELEEMENEG